MYRTPREAVAGLFAHASSSKRSKILKFVLIREALGKSLRFPEAIPEKLGLKLAAAIEADRSVATRLKDALRRVYIMGGQGDGSGNVTPYAEFNIWDDPYSANVVFGSGVPVTLLGLNISRQTSVARDDEDWFTGDSRGERLAAQVLEKWFELDDAEHRARFSLHDPVTIMAALRPDLIETRAATLTVSPITVYSCRSSAPIVPASTSPVWMHTLIASGG